MDIINSIIENAKNILTGNVASLLFSYVIIFCGFFPLIEINSCFPISDLVNFSYSLSNIYVYSSSMRRKSSFAIDLRKPVRFFFLT